MLTRPIDRAATVPTSPDDHVVLLDPFGRPTATAVKRGVHHAQTPFHLAVSCYVVGADGRVLLTRRATGKTFAGVWTNACCGHPRPDESLDDAVRRHMAHEIGVEPVALRLALPDFAYRASTVDGIVEHELCPVFIATIADSAIELNPREADDSAWITWSDLMARAERDPASLSPWCVTQVARLGSLFDDPLEWASRHASEAPRQPSSVGNDPLDHLDRMGREVDDIVESFILNAHAELAGLDPLTVELATPIGALYRAGGKRLRPCLVYCGAASAGDHARPSSHNVAHLAAAVEVLHTFALLHDDVMDKSNLRRGIPTAHRWFAGLRQSGRTVGGEEWFGNSAAIVAGDLAFVWADELLDRLDIDDGTLRRVRNVFNLLRREVIAGQYLDLRLSGPGATDQQALSVALLKSARYTVTRPLQLGATLAAADDATIDALCKYGDAMGVAFQLRDDVLGVFGDPHVTGKGNAEDLRAGKASLLLVRAMELATPADRRLLTRCLGSDDMDEATETDVRAAVLSSGAVASIEALIDAQLDTAQRALAPLPGDVAADLFELAGRLAHREN